MCVSINGPGDLDLFTLKLVRESHQSWGTFLPSLWVFELFTMYMTNGRTDRRTKATLIAPFPTGGA